MTLAKKVKIVEVGPRDGLQSESTLVPSDIKLKLIQQLTAAGLSEIEVGSFVSPKWVPSMANTTEVCAALDKHASSDYLTLVPNIQGLHAAQQANINHIAIFIAASETFSQKNINCSIAESLQRISPVIEQALQHNMQVRGYISCVLGCPYEGKVATQKVIQLSEALLNLGCNEISLGDTIGIGTPPQVDKLLSDLAQSLPIEKFAVHFHDTYAQALLNIYVALQHGITTIDAAVSGLGGCPYAPGASGNVATEDVVYLLNGLGIDTGIDLTQLVQAGLFIDNYLQRNTSSKVAQVLRANM
jgi:hydroxymethylglutaryl-CoA lyase